MAWTKISHNLINDLAYSREKDKTNMTIVNLKKFIAKNEVIAYRDSIGFATTLKRFFENGGRSCGKQYIELEKEIGDYIDHYGFFKTKDNTIIFYFMPYLTKETVFNKFYNSKIKNDFDIKYFDYSWRYVGELLPLFTITLKGI